MQHFQGSVFDVQHRKNEQRRGKGKREKDRGGKERIGEGRREYLKHVISVIKHAENYLLVSFSPVGYLLCCLNFGFIPVKRYHDQGNSYKGHLIGGSVQIQRFSLISRLKKWQCPSRHGAGGDESSTSLSEGSQKTLLPWVELKHRISKSTPTVTYFLKCHIYS